VLTKLIAVKLLSTKDGQEGILSVSKYHLPSIYQISIEKLVTNTISLLFGKKW
jgi:hypothetical protein